MSNIEKDVNGHPIVNMGDELTCSYTGKKFIAARDGCSFNYAWTKDGEVISDEGVDLWEKNELKSSVVFAYVSSDGTNITGWKGNVLARVTSFSESRNGFNGGVIAYVRAIDIYGKEWYGRGGGKGMYVRLKEKK